MPGRGIFGAVELAPENSIFSGCGAGAGLAVESAACRQENAAALENAKAMLKIVVLPDLIRLFLILERRANVKRNPGEIFDCFPRQDVQF